MERKRWVNKDDNEMFKKLRCSWNIDNDKCILYDKVVFNNLVKFSIFTVIIRILISQNLINHVINSIFY